VTHHTGAMATWSKRRLVVFFAFVIPVITVVVKLFGDRYLRPLPMWQQVVIAGALLCVLAALVVYSRRERAAWPRPASSTPAAAH
jgi:xanthine/uracil permease